MVGEREVEERREGKGRSRRRERGRRGEREEEEGGEGEGIKCLVQHYKEHRTLQYHSVAHILTTH